MLPSVQTNLAVVLSSRTVLAPVTTNKRTADSCKCYKSHLLSVANLLANYSMLDIMLENLFLFVYLSVRRAKTVFLYYSYTCIADRFEFCIAPSTAKYVV